MSPEQAGFPEDSGIWESDQATVNRIPSAVSLKTRPHRIVQMPNDSRRKASG